MPNSAFDAGNLLLMFENTAPDENRTGDTHVWATTKEDSFAHGFGIKNIDRDLQAYGGYCEVVGCYQSAEQFLFFCTKDEPHYDFAVLDIQMSKTDGLQLARMIRKEDKLIFLVFITALKKYAPKGYEVSAFRYLIKPLQEGEVFMTMESLGSEDSIVA